MQPLINRRGGLLSHTLRRTKGKNRKNRIEKAPVGVIARFLHGLPISNSFAFNLSGHRHNLFFELAAGRSEQKESAWRRRVPAKEAIPGTSKLSVSSNQLKMIQVSSRPGFGPAMTKPAASPHSIGCMLGRLRGTAPWQPLEK
jgi:hypothetical protein